MSRIDSTFEALQASGRKGFIAYVSAGDPSMARTGEVLDALENSGVDVIELGLPFSDPLADGIVNQMAAQRALEAGSTTEGVLEAIADFRKRSEVPLVLYSYLNPIYTYGYDKFHTDAVTAGLDGILLLDMPSDEASHHQELANHHGLQHIRLIAPTSPPDRIASISSGAEGFVYYVSLEGVTGERSDVAADIAEKITAIRAETDVPVVVGFGISTPDQAAKVAATADAVVVGSAIVRRIGEHGDADGLGDMLEAFLKPLVEAVKSV